MFSDTNLHHHGSQNGYRDDNPSPHYSLNGDSDPAINNNQTEISKWAREAVERMGKGDLEKALHFMNLCLDEKFRNKFLAERTTTTNRSNTLENYTLSDSDELILLEKRCVVQMKLKMYDKVWEGASRIIAKRSNHTVAYKCILASLCKTDKFSHATEVLNLWKKCAPNDLDMMEARTKVENLISAIKNGIEPTNAFSKIEELLGLSTDWMAAGRKVYEPQWKFRPVPTGANSFVLCLQFRFGRCSLGDKCPEAHGEQELDEWKLRYAISNLSTMLSCCTLDREAVYIKTIMDSIMDDQKSFLTAELSGVNVTCSKPLQASLTQVQSNIMKSYSWDFKVMSSRPLNTVCLLYEVHRIYFKIGSAVFLGDDNNKVNLKTGKLASEPQLQVLEVSVNPATLALTGHNLPETYTYNIEIICTSDVFGTFRQTVLFDFGGEPKLVRDISMEVVPPADKNETKEKSAKQPTPKAEDKSESFGSKARTTWNFGNAEIVDSVTGQRVNSSKVGFALMPSPPLKKREPVPNENKDDQYFLDRNNYKDRMRFFLTQEEKARQVILSKYNISAHLTIQNNYDIKSEKTEGGTKYAHDGCLFGRMTLFRAISEDTPVGRLILRSCNSVLLSKTDIVKKSEQNHVKPRVYLCSIVEKTKNAMYFEIGKSCVNEMKLKVGETVFYDIQFQLDRTTFMEQKKVIDQISDVHLKLLFPDFNKDFTIPWNPHLQWNASIDTKDFKLNAKQKEAFNAVTVQTKNSPPILMIGPFGTGKTFTLFQCIKKLLEDETSRVMICTHSNSAADLYVKEYLDPLVTSGVIKAKPLRIYYSLRSRLTVQKEILKYCLFDDKNLFRSPTREEVLEHRVIVVTLSTSFMLIDLKLPSDTFTHILLDEAAQAMESEAITPLLAAGENTKLVLAGDHMQLSPELFSEDAEHFHSSLLERLHCLYSDNHPCKLMLCENYRSHSAIIKFASDSFYQNKLQCGMVQPRHDKFYPLTFFAARGEDVQDPDSTSYFNMAEVFEIGKRVQELIESWPSKWGKWNDENQIGVLTPYPDQVTRIRQYLRKQGCSSIAVERVLNVQGKQFRAVFLSTVRTHKPWVRSLPESVGNEVDLGFFSNPKLLNTALTRAQSLVAVVGDPVSLCSLGKCRRLWEDFINICNNNNSLHGMSYNQIKQSIKGVDMRLTYGLNAMASEFVPKTVSALPPKKEPLLPLPPPLQQALLAITPALTPTEATAYIRSIAPNYANPPNRFNQMPNPWPNTNMPNYGPNYPQFHPQAQMHVVPLGLFITPPPNGIPPAGFPPNGMPPNGFPPNGPNMPPQFGPAFPMIRPPPPMGYHPSMPPPPRPFIAVPMPQQQRSAFAPYRPPPHRPQMGPLPPTSGNPPIMGTNYSNPQYSQAPQRSNTTSHMNQNQSSYFGNDTSHWGGQPLYMTNEYGVMPGPGWEPHGNPGNGTSLLANPTNQSAWPSLPQCQPSGNQCQPEPIPTSYRPPPRPGFPPPPQTLRPPTNTGNPMPMQHPTPTPSAYHPTQNKRDLFSVEEISYMKQLLEERMNAGMEVPDNSIQLLQEKLTLAVSEQTSSSNLPLHFNSTNASTSRSGGLTSMNTNRSIPSTSSSITNPESGAFNPNPSQINCNFSSYTSYRPPVQFGEEQSMNGISGNSTSRYAPPETSTSNVWSSGNYSMPGQMTNGLLPASHSTNYPKSSPLRKNAAIGNTDNSELTLKWTGTNYSAPEPLPSNMFQHNVHENLPHNALSTSPCSDFSRSYASAVKKQPTNQQNNYSPPIGESGDFVPREGVHYQNVTQNNQPMPLMEMDVDFPYQLNSNTSSSHRHRNNMNSPPPRFCRAKGKKEKKSK